MAAAGKSALDALCHRSCYRAIDPVDMKLPLIALLLSAATVLADPPLPDPLTLQSGAKVTSIEQWRSQRRPELLELFRSEVYGRAPVGRPESLSFEVVERADNVMNGAADRKQVKIRYSGPGGEGAIHLILFTPAAATTPSPCLLFICNRGKENIDPTRQKQSPFWPAEAMIARGYAAATFHNGDVDPDKHDGFKNGVHGIFDGPEPRKPDAWGTIAAWAWGASRVMDYLETDRDIDQGKVVILGHSRGGKTSLWAGAQDERFAMAVSNNSGCTGAKIARHPKGESVERINRVFPHWFSENYKKYNDRHDALPIDQHELIALMAPRPVYVASASGDTDPEGEFLGAKYASSVYERFGLQGLGDKSYPAPGTDLGTGHIGYHLREGAHNLLEYDWERFMDFADRHFGRTSSTSSR